MSSSKVFEPEKAIPVPRATTTRIMLHHLQGKGNHIYTICQWPPFQTQHLPYFIYGWEETEWGAATHSIVNTLSSLQLVRFNSLQTLIFCSLSSDNICLQSHWPRLVLHWSLVDDGRKIMVQVGTEVIKEGALDVHVLLGLETNFLKRCNSYFHFLV